MSIWRPSALLADREPASPVVRRHRPDYQIVLYMGLHMMIGLVVLYSISPARVELINANTNSSLDAAHFMQRQLVSLAAGLVVFVAAGFLPTKYWKKYAWPLLLTGFAACALLAFLGLFDSTLIVKTNGAVRWFNLGFMTFQPAELLKFGFIIFSATFLGRQVAKGKLNDLGSTLLPLGILFAIAAVFIIVFQKDMGTGITLIGAVAALLFAAGLDKRWMLIGVIGVIGAVVLLTLTSPHRVERVLTFLQTSSNSATTDESDAASYHINQAMIALGSGGFFGKGLGQGVQAFGYLPEAVNDSIFAILGETFGYVGLIVIMILFGGLLRRVLMVADRTVDVTDRLIVAGLFGLIASHIVVNIGAMTGVFPLTGVTLPFLSFGGTSLLFTSLGLGVVFYISRYTTHQKLIEQEGSSETAVRRRGVGRSRYAGSRRYQSGR
jgi:cell division protein FtsW